MSNLNSLCIDDYSNLVLKFEKTDDIATDTDMENWLDFEYEQNGPEWIFPKTKDVVKLSGLNSMALFNVFKLLIENAMCIFFCSIFSVNGHNSHLHNPIYSNVYQKQLTVLKLNLGKLNFLK